MFDIITGPYPDYLVEGITKGRQAAVAHSERDFIDAYFFIQ